MGERARAPHVHAHVHNNDVSVRRNIPISVISVDGPVRACMRACVLACVRACVRVQRNIPIRWRRLKDF